jgi:DNA (cytosine-5)-methyltransferase 1
MMLILSLFPGIGLLDRAFEEAWPECCIVRGPDVLWGGDVKTFHPPAGRFDGVIGGPPCQAFSRLRHLVEANGYEKAENLIPEFERCVREAAPRWFLMENVPAAPEPQIEGYAVWCGVLNNRLFGGVQNRERRFSFGVRGERIVHLDRGLFEQVTAIQGEWEPAVCASGGVKPGCPTDRRTRAKYLGWKTAAALKDSIRLQGLPEDFLDKAPFTQEGKHKVVGNGVPLPLGKALATAVRSALISNA